MFGVGHINTYQKHKIRWIESVEENTQYDRQTRNNADEGSVREIFFTHGEHFLNQHRNANATLFHRDRVKKST